MGSVNATPMMQQYLSIKDQYPDAILFYRMGDFYEMFFEDAQTASAVLEITLTSRNKNDPHPIPMCGVPVKAADGYIGRLIGNGYKVAVCEQVQDPSTARGLVDREVVRIVTPGMIVDNDLLERDANNYVLAVARRDQVIGLSVVDISTGAFRLCESNDARAIRDELLRIGPREIILPESARADSSWDDVLSLFGEKTLTCLADGEFEYAPARDRLIRQFSTRSLEGYGCEGMAAGVGAAGALLGYVLHTQKQQVGQITGIETYHLHHYLLIDDTTCRNLELFENLRNGTRRGTLMEVLDGCVTAMGSRLLRQWLSYPLLDPEKIVGRHDAVTEAAGNFAARHQAREHLKSVYDMERLTSRAVMGRANARDLVALKRSLQALPDILRILAVFHSRFFSLTDCLSDAEQKQLAGLAGLLEAALREDAPPTIQEGGLIREDYHPELRELIAISRDSKSWLAGMEAREKARTGINSLKVRYNRVFGYYLEVPRSQTGAVPGDYVRKQTLANAERYVTDELKAFESRALGAEEQRLALELSIFNDIRRQVADVSRLIFSAAAFAARVDVLCSLAETAVNNHYVRPEITGGGEIHMTDGRHPVVEKMLTAERYVPNTVRLDDTENQLLIITGPNMAGKSTILRQVALCAIMAQMGSFVPARQYRTGIVDRIFSRVGALDNLASGQSTFMVEMEETANIINNATPRSLIIIDEIGRGTSTYDGLSIAWAVAEHLHDLGGKGVKTLFATHYHELTDLAAVKTRAKNFNIAVKEWNDDIIFLRRLVEGSTNRSYGIQVARLAGIPAAVIARAKQILYDIEQGKFGFEASAVPQKAKAGKGPVQLSFFDAPENILARTLDRLDISGMTPLEALNCLNDLKQKAEKLLPS
ncbi:MAG: DNA mismatch repair protein MutS [Thermodesulfobacteriota bacterium]